MEPLLPSDPSHLGGHRLLGRLGAGGMGVVYLARSGAGELTALKVIRPDFAEQPEFRARFRREVAAAQRVDSPWVARVAGADPEATAPWLAAAFVPGPSLAEAVAECGPLPADAVRVLGKVLAHALTAVHTAGLVHRDVKPGNVLLALEGPRLIDFGIARAAADDQTALTAEDVVVGTPGFLAPEQARAGRAGPAADVFSLGCVLAHAATGRPPFGSGDSGALLYRTVHDAPDLAGIEDDELRGLLQLCLSKEELERPSAADVAAALTGETAAEADGIAWLPDPVVRMVADRAAELLALPPVEATVVTGDTTAPRPGRRRALALAGAALLAGGAGTGLWALSRDDGAPAAKPARRWTLGVHADLSGPQREAGQAQERAVRLAVEEFNSRTDKAFRLDLRVEDDRGEAGRANAAAQRFTDDRDVLAVFGPTGVASAPAIEVYEGARLAVVSVSELTLVAMTGALAAPARYYFRAAAMNNVTPFGAALTLYRKGARRLGLMVDRAGRATGFEPGSLMAQVAPLVRLTVHDRFVPAAATDLEPVVADILRSGVDSFYYSGTPQRAATVAQLLTARGFDGHRILDPGSATPAFVAAAGPGAEGWQALLSYSDPAAPGARKFAAAHRKRYGAAPGPWATEAYDAARLVIDRLAALAGDRARRPSRDALAQALGKARFQGINGTYTFDKDRCLNARQVYRYQVQGGRFRYAEAVKVA